MWRVELVFFKVIVRFNNSVICCTFDHGMLYGVNTNLMTSALLLTNVTTQLHLSEGKMGGGGENGRFLELLKIIFLGEGVFG